jgi:hypothetical protein
VKKFLALFLAFAFAAGVLTSTTGCGGDTKKADAPKGGAAPAPGKPDDAKPKPP